MYLALYLVVAKICKAILLYVVRLQQHKKEGRRYLVLYFAVAKICKAIILYIVPLK